MTSPRSALLRNPRKTGAASSAPREEQANSFANSRRASAPFALWSASSTALLTLADVPTGQRCILDRLDLPEEMARRLMELGFLPGNEVMLGRRIPGGGPRIFRVDGSEVALRKETAARMYVRRHIEADLVVIS
jgi:ferrous iron transport protein A